MLIPATRLGAPRRNRFMSVVYILAHFDDEYCALPLIWQAAREGLTQRFVYLVDYRDAALGARRLAETRRFLARQGIAGSAILPLGLASGVFDQSLHLGAGLMFPRLAQAVAEAGGASRLVVPAWEGGHMDHDACAFMAVRLAEQLGGPPIRQFTLYNGPGLAGPLLRGGAPLKENGPSTPVHLTPGQWARWMAGVRAFPSQAYAWSGIWPAMFAGMARRGFAWQALQPGRVQARPHAGPLFYERMFKIGYAEVRAALDAAFPASAMQGSSR
jgi:LmbE family N-acetylglucosaminyl deacetylase